MDGARARLLADLLREMRREDGEYFPEEAWLEIHRTFAIPYVEVAITRQSEEGVWQFYLRRRDADDPYWPGRPWHIPGGVWRLSRSREQACDDVARRECGVPVARSVEVLTKKGTDHPYANPISHLCVCYPTEEPVETDSGRFFSIEGLPEPLLTGHREFLLACHGHLVGRP